MRDINQLNKTTDAIVDSLSKFGAFVVSTEKATNNLNDRVKNLEAIVIELLDVVGKVVKKEGGKND